MVISPSQNYFTKIFTTLPRTPATELFLNSYFKNTVKAIAVTHLSIPFHQLPILSPSLNRQFIKIHNPHTTKLLLNIPTPPLPPPAARPPPPPATLRLPPRTARGRRYPDGAAAPAPRHRPPEEALLARPRHPAPGPRRLHRRPLRRPGGVALPEALPEREERVPGHPALSAVGVRPARGSAAAGGAAARAAGHLGGEGAGGLEGGARERQF